IFQELKQNWVVKVRLNIEFLQPRKLLKVSSNIWGSLQAVFFCSKSTSIIDYLPHYDWFSQWISDNY
ncbi:MAG: hypothetical protein AB1470_03615, partial [Bacillota bacterium]